MSHFQKILVPMDGSPASIAALEEALVLAEDLAAEIEVLHVYAPDRFELASSTGASEAARTEDEREMEDAIGGAKALIGDRLNRRTESGEPVRTIIEVAAEDAADLIVIGTHGRVGRLHALVGSVTEGVVRAAPCPVLTVRSVNGEEESFAERIHGRQSMAEQARSPRR
jgi:nucleotide-binding universal stress UspA family protein